MKRQIKTIMKLCFSLPIRLLLIAGLSTLSSVYAQEEQDTVAVAVAVEPVADSTVAVEPVIDSTVAVVATEAEPVEAVEAVEAADETQTDSAAAYCPHEIGIWLSGGSNNLFYKSSFGDKSLGWGGAFGVGYTWFFHRNWGIGLGAELALYQGQVRLNNLTDSYWTTDIEGDELEYAALFDDYKEYQYLGNVNIPLNFIFQTKMRNEHKFYASVAFKLGIPIWNEYNSGKNATLSTSGYYPDQNQTLGYQDGHYVDYPDLGYGTFRDVHTKGKYPNLEDKSRGFDLSYMGQVEVGFKWHLAPGRDLYTGVYAEYAFNDVMKGGSPDRFITYNSTNPSELQMSSVLTSEYRQDGVSNVFTDKVALLGVGLKVKIGISAGCKDQLDAERAARAAKKAAKKQAKKDAERQDRMDDLQYLQAQQQALGGGGGNGGTSPEVEAARQYADAARAAAEQAKIEADRAREERDAYLKDADKRRDAFERDVTRPNKRLRDMDNYNLAIVTLNPVQKSDLDYYIDMMKENEELTLKITGHTCDISSYELNMRIGQERADLAKDYMVENGISPQRITTFSKGETAPIYPNNNAVNRKKNRRLEMDMR
jgi:outer membrane protein OmpA-like peptidoglycan-associated protein